MPGLVRTTVRGMTLHAAPPGRPEIQTPDASIRDALDRDGFAVLPGVLSDAEVEPLRALVDGLLASEGPRAGIEVHQEAGSDRLANLIDKHPRFRGLLRHPLVLGCVDHILGGDWKLSSLNSRSPAPGMGVQALHTDWGRSVAPGSWEVCNTAWLLDGTDRGNGATRLVPGSHRWRRLPHEAMADAQAAHPDEVIIRAAAGSVLVFNSHCWHGGTRNVDGRPRRALFAYFTRRANPPQTDHARMLSSQTLAELTPQERWILSIG